MANFPSSRVNEHPRSASAPGCADGVNDGQLLDLFILHKDESAFAELVQRHGRMVLGVCRRVLDNPHDAEDCFQASFLVLVRKAATIHPREMVGNWLYGVAYRTALEAKKMAARRRNRERRKFDMARYDSESERWQELQPVLDQEMSKLPEKFRFVLVACDIEGRTRKDVAHALGLPEGTVASRLARARAMLAKRLTRRNLAMSATAIAMLLAEQASADCVPASLADSTTHAAALLAAGKPVGGLVSGDVAGLVNAVIRSMLIAKLKVASVVLVVLTILGLGVGMMLPSASAERKAEKPQVMVKAKKEKPEQVHDCVVEMIDLSSRKVQTARLDTEEGGTTFQEFQVDPNAAVIIAGKDANLTDLKVGACVNVEFLRGANGVATAVRIEAIGEAVSGIVHAVNADSVTIESQSVKEKKTYELKKNSWVVINGKKGKLDELKLKMLVALHADDKRKVAGVHAAGPKVVGVVKSVKADTLSLGIPNTSLCADGIAVAPDAVVTIDGKKAALADLREGMNVTLQMSAETDRSYIVGITCGKR